MTDAELRAIRERHAEVVAWEQAEPPIDPPRNMTWPDCHEDRGSLLAALDAERKRADALAEALDTAVRTAHAQVCWSEHPVGYDDCQWSAMCKNASAALRAHREARP